MYDMVRLQTIAENDNFYFILLFVFIKPNKDENARKIITHTKKSQCLIYTIYRVFDNSTIAISQASCRIPDNRRGAALPQEDVGDMLV
jgi:hypothetical protein